MSRSRTLLDCCSRKVQVVPADLFPILWRSRHACFSLRSTVLLNVGKKKKPQHCLPVRLLRVTNVLLHRWPTYSYAWIVSKVGKLLHKINIIWWNSISLLWSYAIYPAIHTYDMNEISVLLHPWRKVFLHSDIWANSASGFTDSCYEIPMRQNTIFSVAVIVTFGCCYYAI